MKNPPTRPYTPEELEALLGEEAQERKALSPTASQSKSPQNVIFKNNTAGPTATELERTAPESNPPRSSRTTNRYAPYIIAGIIVVGMGVYLYYQHQKNKEKQPREKS